MDRNVTMKPNIFEELQWRGMIFDRVEGKRLLNELIHVMDEKAPLAAIKAMSELGVLQAIYPPMTADSRTYSLIESVSSVLSWWKYLFLEDKKDCI